MDIVNILDRGYLKYIEHWGSDERIIEAARMSTNKGFKGWGPVCKNCGLFQSQIESPTMLEQTCEHELVAGDEKLLRYLWTHKHHTPFEMAGLTIEVQAPIFVFREWHRHRTQSYNEMSARYTELPNLFYTPSEERLNHGKQSNKNKQSSEGGFDTNERSLIYHNIQFIYDNARETYEQLLAMGMAREIARIVLPVAQYSRMRASANLRNWLAFLTLRMDSSAQWEIRQYANVLATIVEHHFPRTYQLFQEGHATSNN